MLRQPRRLPFTRLRVKSLRYWNPPSYMLSHIATISMRELLALAGFRLRGASRADCAHCSGSSLGTVSYRPEVAHCFRCGWSANPFQLARRLGFARGLGQARGRAKARPETRRESLRRAQNENEIRAFARWREERLRQATDRFHSLSRAAVRAGRALSSGALTPEEQELAWDALGRFYSEEARLGAALDLLTCAKASAWLEDDARVEELFLLWKDISSARP